MRLMYFLALAKLSRGPSRMTPPYEAGPGLPRAPPSMFARYAAAAGGLGCGGASANKSFPRGVGGRFGIRSLSKPPKLYLRNQRQDSPPELVPGCRESARSFRTGILLRWFPNAVPEECEARRAFRSRGTARRGLQPWRGRCGALRCALKARPNLPGQEP